VKAKTMPKLTSASANRHTRSSHPRIAAFMAGSSKRSIGHRPALTLARMALPKSAGARIDLLQCYNVAKNRVPAIDYAVAPGECLTAKVPAGRRLAG
jgi:hypothetical protein